LSIEFPDGGRDLPSIGCDHHSPIDDVDPQATRSLFVGNIPKNISIYELRDIFQRFGDVLVSFVVVFIVFIVKSLHDTNLATFVI
jgi:RNA recognition motif-containing protein